jgi:hypothetical protein
MDTVPGVYPGIEPVHSGTIKPRRILTMSRFLLGHDMQTHNNSLANLRRGVGERVLFRDRALTECVPDAPGIFVERLASYRDAIVQRIGFQTPVTRSTFVGYYKGPRKLTYQRAVDGLAISPLRPNDAYLKTFVKAEKLNFTLKPDPAPRVIQPRDPRYNVEVGKFLRPIEHKMYSAIDDLFKSPTIMSQYNAYTQAKILHDKWIKFRRPVCVGLDASRFDQHVSKQALRFEHSIYNHIFKSVELWKLLKMQLVNRGFARAQDGEFSYVKHGSRMSGDMNTSMGNKILMCLMSLSYLQTLEIPFEFVNNGDDCLIFTEEKYLCKLNNMEDYYRDFGFDIVREKPVKEFEQIEFCQTKPVQANGIWRMVRNAKTCLSKDLTSITLGHDVQEYRCLLNSIADCGLATAGDVPVLGEFYRMLKRFGKEGKYTGMWDNEYSYYHRSSKNARCLHTHPDAHARYSYWLGSGIAPDEQVEIEKYFQQSVWGGDKRQIIDQLLPI